MAAQAIPYAEKATELARKIWGAKHEDYASKLNFLARLYRLQGRYAEAEPLSKRALAIREKVYGANHSLVAQSLNNLAELYDAQGRYAEAEPRARPPRSGLGLDRALPDC